MDLTRNRLVVKPTDWKPAGTGIIVNKDTVIDKIAPDINTSDLLDSHIRRRNQRAKICERVYRKCCQRIRHANDVLYAKECLYKVPPVQLWGGVPTYQVPVVVGYIMIRLKQKGFDVRYLPPDGVQISWKKAVSGDTFTKFDTTVKYELDEIASAGPKLSHLATAQERMLHEGCKGECCGGDLGRPQRVVNKKQLLELERRKQQLEIDRLIQQKDRSRR